MLLMTNRVHRNKSAMTPESFVTTCEELLGPDTPVWRKRFCNLTGYSQSTVTRMIAGTIPVTELVASLLFALEIMAFNDRVDYMDEFGLSEVR